MSRLIQKNEAVSFVTSPLNVGRRYDSIILLSETR